MFDRESVGLIRTFIMKLKLQEKSKGGDMRNDGLGREGGRKGRWSLSRNEQGVGWKRTMGTQWGVGWRFECLDKNAMRVREVRGPRELKCTKWIGAVAERVLGHPTTP
jgi:hypothetical protein